MGADRSYAPIHRFPEPLMEVVELIFNGNSITMNHPAVSISPVRSPATAAPVKVAIILQRMSSQGLVL